MPQNRRSVCLILDSRFLTPAKVTLGTLLYHASTPLNVYTIVPRERDVNPVEEAFQLVLDKLKETGRALASTLRVTSADEYMRRIERLPSNDARRGVTATSYLKFYIPDLIEDEWVLYIDVDTIVTGDIEQIFRAVSGTSGPIAGVRNSNTTQRHWLDLSHGRGIPSDRYMNTGVMVMNLQVLRERGASAALERIVREHARLMVHKDQDALNALFGPSFLELDQRFNVHDFSLSVNYSGRPDQILISAFDRVFHLQGRLSELLTPRVQADTVVCHFSGNPKPWRPTGYFCRAHSSAWHTSALQFLSKDEIADLRSIRKLALAGAARASQLVKLFVALCWVAAGRSDRRGTAEIARVMGIRFVDYPRLLGRRLRPPQ